MRWLLVLAVIALLVGACSKRESEELSQDRGSPAPVASAATTGAAAQSASAAPQASAPGSPTSATPTQGATTAWACDLNAILPASIGGLATTKTCVLGTDSRVEDLSAMLKAHDIAPDKVQVATASTPENADAGAEWVRAIRIPGVPATTVFGWIASASGVTATPPAAVQVGGKSVVRDTGASTAVDTYLKDETLIDLYVLKSNEAEVLHALP